MTVNWTAKIARARKFARDHDTLDCLDELERRCAVPMVDIGRIKADETISVTVVSPSETDSIEVKDRKSYMRDYMRKKRAAEKGK